MLNIVQRLRARIKKNLLILSTLSMLFFTNNLFGHSVQIQYCVNCNGDLRIWVEHWHGNQNPNSTTMTIDVDVNGTTTTYTSSPGGGVIDVPAGNLPGCSTPLIYGDGCPGDENTYNDWVYYDFLGLPTNQPITVTIQSGNTAFTQDGCGMFPYSFNFTIDGNASNLADQNVCAGNATAATPLNATWSWTNDNPAIGLPANGTGDIPSFVPQGPPGTSATISYVNNCTSGSFVITIVESPNPQFTVTDGAVIEDSLCLGNPFFFTDNSTIPPPDNIIDWSWDMGSGDTLTGQNPPSYTYTAPGTYLVNLTVTSDQGCSITSPDVTLVVHPTPVASFTVADVCAYDQINAVSNSNIAAPDNIADYQWDLGDGNNATGTNVNHSYSAFGTFNITLTTTSNNGCVDDTIIPVTIHPVPIASFTVNDECVYDQITATSNSTISLPDNIANYGWNFGDGNTGVGDPINHLYANDGSYNITLQVTTNNGCIDDTIIPVTIHPEPLASFTVNDECVYDQIAAVSNSNVNAPATITDFSWDLGDGNMANGANINHQYASSGTYNIQLTTTTDNGCVDDTIIPVTIHPEPIPSFTVTDVCVYNQTTVNSTSVIAAPDNITTTDWDFGDGNTGTGTTLNHQYALDGTYSIAMSLTSNNGCVNDTTIDVIIFPEPLASYTYAGACSYEPLDATSNSTVNNPDVITNWDWDLGDGNTATGSNIVHNYAISGTYDVMLTVTTDNGCVDDTTITVTFNPVPNSSFTVANVCEYDQINAVSNGTVTAPDVITNWDWDFGDGNTATGSNVNHQYASNGTYNITLTSTTNNNCVDDTTITVIIYPEPDPSFTVNDVCIYDAINAVSTSTVDAPDNIATYDWDLGDGNTANGANINHQYANHGTYNIQLTTTTNNGCVNSVTMPVTIYPIPNPNFTSTTVCVNGSATDFTDLSTIPSGTIVSWNWDFANGAFSALQHPSNDYSVADDYDVTLGVTSDFGCFNDTTITITVYEQPYAAFTSNLTQVCSPDDIEFYDISSTDQSPVVNWVWNFFGGVADNNGATNPIVTYTNGNYDPTLHAVELIVTNSLGCSDTVVVQDYIQVFPTPVSQFSYATSTTDMSVQFYNESVNADAYDWDFGIPGEGSSVTSPTYLYPGYEPGSYDIMLIASAHDFCFDTSYQTIYLDVLLYFAPNVFTPNGDEFNNDWNLKIFSGVDIYDYHLMIFNRWGELLFESYDPSVGWDGTYGGQIVADDVYIWKIDFKETMSDKRHKNEGHVTVLK